MLYVGVLSEARSRRAQANFVRNRLCIYNIGLCIYNIDIYNVILSAI